MDRIRSELQKSLWLSVRGLRSWVGMWMIGIGGWGEFEELMMGDGEWWREGEETRDVIKQVGG